MLVTCVLQNITKSSLVFCGNGFITKRKCEDSYSKMLQKENIMERQLQKDFTKEKIMERLYKEKT